MANTLEKAYPRDWRVSVSHHPQMLKLVLALLLESGNTGDDAKRHEAHKLSSDADQTVLECPTDTVF